MKKSSYIYLICILCICACGSDLSPSEEKIKNEISSIYLADATFEDIKNATLGDTENLHVKNINVSRSPVLDTLGSTFALNSIATIAYENLSQEERNMYDYIGLEIAQKSGEANPFSFKTNTLEKINNTKKVAYQFADAISSASFKNMESILDTGQAPAEAAAVLQNYFKELTVSAGAIESYYFYGVGQGEHQSNKFYTHLGKFTYKNGMTQNFFVNVFEGDVVTTGYNVSPINK